MGSRWKSLSSSIWIPSASLFLYLPFLPLIAALQTTLQGQTNAIQNFSTFPPRLRQSRQRRSASKAQRHCQHAQKERRESFWPTTLPLTLLLPPLTLMLLQGLKKRKVLLNCPAQRTSGQGRGSFSCTG